MRRGIAGFVGAFLSAKSVWGIGGTLLNLLDEVLLARYERRKIFFFQGIVCSSI